MQQRTNDLERLEAVYGDLPFFPSRRQWHTLLELDRDAPIVICNFFCMNETAQYEPSTGLSGTGHEAVERYSAITVPMTARFGVDVIYAGAVVATAIGEDEDWEQVAIVNWPKCGNFFDLHLDPIYIEKALPHRRAFTRCAKMIWTSPLTN